MHTLAHTTCWDACKKVRRNEQDAEVAGRVHGAAEQVRTCLDEIYMSVGKMEGAYNGVHKRAKRLLQEVDRLNLAGTPPSTRPHSSPRSNCKYHPRILRNKQQPSILRKKQLLYAHQLFSAFRVVACFSRCAVSTRLAAPRHSAPHFVWATSHVHKGARKELYLA